MRRRTRRSAPTIGAGTPDMTIGRAAADQAGARPYPNRCAARRCSSVLHRRQLSDLVKIESVPAALETPDRSRPSLPGTTPPRTPCRP
jgi:hypothetical protein